MQFSSSFLKTPQSPRETIIPSQPEGAITLGKHITDPNADLDIRVATCDLQKSQVYGYFDFVRDNLSQNPDLPRSCSTQDVGFLRSHDLRNEPLDSDSSISEEYFNTELDSLDLLALGENTNLSGPHVIRDDGVLSCRSLRYMPLTHYVRQTLRRLPIYEGNYVYDFPCFPVNVEQRRGSIHKWCKRWIDSGTILVMIKHPKYREKFLVMLYNKRLTPIFKNSKNRIRISEYKQSRDDKKGFRSLRKYSPCFWEFLHEGDKIEGHGLGTHVLNFAAATGVMISIPIFGMYNSFGAFQFITSFVTAGVSAYAIANDPITTVARSIWRGTKGMAIVNRFYLWVSGLWDTFDNKCLKTFGVAWSCIDKPIRQLIVCVGSCAAISTAICASVVLTKMLHDLLGYTTFDENNKVEAHSDTGPIESGVIACLCLSFLLCGADSSVTKSFGLFNQMYRCLDTGVEVVDGIIPYKKWINRLCAFLGMPRPFDILKFQQEIEDIERDATIVLDDPKFLNRLRSDKTLPSVLGSLKKRATDILESIRFNRNVNTNAKTQLHRTLTRLCKAHVDCIKLNDRYCKRPLPVWLEMRGAPGQGKTEVANIVSKEVFRRIKGRTMEHTDYFSKTPGSPYWAGYDPESSWCTYMDEFLTSTLVQVNQPEASALLNMVGTEYCPLDMADVESKGVTAFRSSMIVTTGNGNFNITGLANPDALRRRIAFPLTVIRAKDLPPNPRKEDFDKAWKIVVNTDFIAQPQAYKGIWRGLNTGRTYTLSEITDLVYDAVVAADVKKSLYDTYINAHGQQQHDAEDGTEIRAAVFKSGDRTLINYLDLFGQWHSYSYNGKHMIKLDEFEGHSYYMYKSFKDIWVALSYITKVKICEIEIEVVEDDMIMIDKAYNKYYRCGFIPTGDSGFLNYDDLYNIGNFTGIIPGPFIECGQGTATLSEVYEELMKPDMVITMSNIPGRGDVSRHKIDLFDDMVNGTNFSFIPYNLRTKMHEYAMPIAIALGLFVGASAVIAGIVSSYTAADLTEGQSIRKHDVPTTPIPKSKEPVLPKYTGPTMVHGHGAIDDAMSLLPNIMGILSEGTGMKCWGLWFDNKTMITVGHVMRYGGNLRVYSSNQVKYSTYSPSDYATFRVENSDMCFVFFRRPMTGIKSIMSRICDTPVPVNASVKRLQVMTSGSTVGCGFTLSCNTTSSVGINYLCKNGVKIYPISNYINVDEPTGKVGDCGLPYLRLENGAEKITGIHFGGTDKHSCMQNFTRDMIKFYMTHNPFTNLTMEPSVIEPHAVVDYDTALKEGVDSIGTLRCKPSYYPRGNTRRSVLALEGEGLPDFPAIVHKKAPATCHGIIGASANDFSRKGVYNGSPIMDKILSENLLREFFNYDELLKNPWPHPDKYTPEEIVLGIPGEFHGLSDSTSIGPLFKRGLYGIKPKTKKDLWNVEDRWMNEDFKTLLHERIDKGRQGIVVPTVVEAQRKDETRDVKAKKITICGVSGIKPRQFCVTCPLDVAEAKCLLWPFMQAMHKTPVVSQCGINPWSMDWTCMMQDLDQRPYAMFTDVKGFDMTVGIYEFLNHLEECLLEMYAQYDDEELNNRIKVLMSKILEYYIIYDDQLGVVRGTNISGGWLTTIINCARNWWYLKSCYLYMREVSGSDSNLKFEENVTAKTNGDDNFVTISYAAGKFFNMATYADIMNIFFGATVTDLDKVPLIDKVHSRALFHEFKDAEFLSRKFNKLPNGRYLAPLDIASIWNSVYWTKTEPTNKKDRVAHYTQIIEGCLRELALHDEKEFNLFRDVIKPRYSKIGGVWLTDWNYKSFRDYMESLAMCTDVKKVPTPYGCVQGHCTQILDLGREGNPTNLPPRGPIMRVIPRNPVPQNLVQPSPITVNLIISFMIYFCGFISTISLGLEQDLFLYIYLAYLTFSYLLRFQNHCLLLSNYFITTTLRREFVLFYFLMNFYFYCVNRNLWFLLRSARMVSFLTFLMDSATIFKIDTSRSFMDVLSEFFVHELLKCFL